MCITTKRFFFFLQICFLQAFRYYSLACLNCYFAMSASNRFFAPRRLTVTLRVRGGQGAGGRAGGRAGGADDKNMLRRARKETVKTPRRKITVKSPPPPPNAN